MFAYQLLEHVLSYLYCRQHTWQQQQQQLGGDATTAAAAKKQPQDSRSRRAASSAADSRQGRDTDARDAAMAPRPAQATMQQLLVALHACAGATWQALVHKPSDLGVAVYVLQAHEHARRCMLLLLRICSAAGLREEMRQQLRSLLLSGAVWRLQLAEASHADTAEGTGEAGAAAQVLVVVKQEPPLSQDAGATSSSTPAGGPQQLAVPLLHSLQQLMACCKAYSAAAKRQSATATAGAAGPGSSKPVVSPAEACCARDRAESLSVAGVGTWGLVAHVLGPHMLDKAVGQPLLNVSKL